MAICLTLAFAESVGKWTGTGTDAGTGSPMIIYYYYVTGRVVAVEVDSGILIYISDPEHEVNVVVYPKLLFR